MSWRDADGRLVPGRKPGSANRTQRGFEIRRCRCGTEFRVQHCQIKSVIGGGSYCSPQCHYEAMRGREFATVDRYTRPDGYIAMRVGLRKWELEHRLIMEREIGRTLRTDEHVHHINGDRADNRLENLQLIDAREHARLHAVRRCA